MHFSKKNFVFVHFKHKKIKQKNSLKVLLDFSFSFEYNSEVQSSYGLLFILGYRQTVRQRTLTPSFSRFESL